MRKIVEFNGYRYEMGPLARRLDKVTGKPKAKFWQTVVIAFALWAIGTIPFVLVYLAIGAIQ